jgi:hypothetical protein
MTKLRDQITQLIEGKSSKGFFVVLSKQPNLLAQLTQTTDKYDPKNLSERLWILINGEPPVCEQGNKRQFNTWELGYRAGCVLGNKCACVGKLRMQNQKITLREKYGVDTVNAVPGVKQKRKQTNQQKYGVDYPVQNPKIKEKLLSSHQLRTAEQKQHQQQKRKATTIKKYGIDHHMKTDQCLLKQQQTNQQKYGVNRPLQNADILAKSIATQSLRSAEEKAASIQKAKHTIETHYSVSAPSRIGMDPAVLDILDNAEKFCEYAKTHTREQMSSQMNIHPHTVYLYSKKYSAESLFVKPQLSQFEIEVRAFVQSITSEFVCSDRSVLLGKELDIYIPQKQLAIECSGLYWHSEIAGQRTKEYHTNKYQQCTKLGINLITIWEDQWNFKKDQCKQRLTYLLKASQSTVSARKCTVEWMTPEASADFFDQHHIQGSAGARYHVGLKCQNQLVAAMSFRKPRFSKKYEWELIRLATAGSVPGAAGRMFAFFVKQINPTSVISYCDHSWGTGQVYDKLGFKYQSTQTGYWYTDYKQRLNRMQFQRKQIAPLVENSENLTEWQIMQQLKYDRIWDCGQSTWIWHK